MTLRKQSIYLLVYLQMLQSTIYLDVQLLRERPSCQAVGLSDWGEKIEERG